MIRLSERRQTGAICVIVEAGNGVDHAGLFRTSAPSRHHFVPPAAPLERLLSWSFTPLGVPLLQERLLSWSSASPGAPPLLECLFSWSASSPRKSITRRVSRSPWLSRSTGLTGAPGSAGAPVKLVLRAGHLSGFADFRSVDRLAFRSPWEPLP